jgi:DNA-binding Lrp family transcriptional regulator
MGSAVRDETDQRIARFLIDHPTATDDTIAAKLNLHKNTVQRRKHAMVEEKVIAPSAAVLDWAAIGFPFRYRIDIQIEPLALRHAESSDEDAGPPDWPDKSARKIKSQEQFARFIQSDLVKYVAWRIKEGMEEDVAEGWENFADQVIVHDVVILLGHAADMYLTLRAKNQTAVRKFVTAGLRMMRGVHTTTTSQEVWSCAEVK